jgi:predicted type IV restriction endonuclease
MAHLQLADPHIPRVLERLERWKKWPSFNEEATLLGLVLPVLQEAGYDPFNPEEVFPRPRTPTT